MFKNRKFPFTPVDGESEVKAEYSFAYTKTNRAT